MNIAAMNVRITFQKNVIVTDKIGNHRNEWSDIYSCWATPLSSNLSEKEELEAGTIVTHEKQDFTIRYTEALAGLDCTKLRILFNGNIFNVLSIDMMGCKKRSLKFRCEKVRR